MDFKSPRFAGNALLEQILNDPDSTQVKLGAGSPAESVQPVQQALADLHWPFRVIPPVLTDPFADGDFGDGTNRTVVAFKTYYGIHYPPTEPVGLIDGFVGPRTIFRLDVLIASFDESVIGIDAKIADLQAAGVAVEPDPVLGADTWTVQHQWATQRWVNVDGTTGLVVNTTGIGAYEVHGAIFLAYMPQRDRLGMPTSDEHDGPPGTRESDFERGTLRYDFQTGVVTLVNAGAEPPPVF